MRVTALNRQLDLARLQSRRMFPNNPYVQNGCQVTENVPSVSKTNSPIESGTPSLPFRVSRLLSPSGERVGFSSDRINTPSDDTRNVKEH